MARLHKRYWRVLDRGKAPGVVVVALARELAGFLWAVLHEQQWRAARAGACGVTVTKNDGPRVPA